MYNKLLNSFLIVFLFPSMLLAQKVLSANCNKIRQGVFYFYPSNPKGKYTIIRKSSIQMEINVETMDTSLWKVHWTNDCFFNLQFIRSTQPMSDALKSFYNSHVTVIKVLKVTKDYYTFKGGLDSITIKNNFTDTLWFKAKPY